MNTATFIVVGLACLVLYALVGGVRELLVRTTALRVAGGIIDKPRPLAVSYAGDLNELGVPVGYGGRAMLIVSDRCLACYSVLAAAAHEILSGRLVVLLNARTRLSGEEWLDRNGMVFANNVVFDEYGLIAAQLGLTLSPSLVIADHGIAVGAMTIPSPRQLRNALMELSSPPRSTAVAPLGGLL